MSPVQLPLGLPSKVLKEMVDRFRKFLFAEICTMMERERQPSKKHIPHFSIESGSGLSTSSKESGDHLKDNVWDVRDSGTAADANQATTPPAAP